MTSNATKKLRFDPRYLKFLKAYTLCRDKVDYPFQWLMVEPTNHCNLRCVMCPQAGKMTRKKGYMEFSLFQKILDQSDGFLKTMQLFHSGEALLHPRIFDMIHNAALKNIYTLINTNGTLLDEKKSHALLDSGLNSISFSFDSFHKETYESIRVGAKFENTLKNIDYFLNLKAKKGQRWPEAIIEIVDMMETRPYINAFMSRAKKMGFDEVRVWKFHNWTDDDQVAEKHNPFSIKANAYYPCEYPFFLSAIYWDGTVAPCCIDYNGGYPLGNIKDSSLKNIWNNQKYRYLRSTMRSKKTQKTNLCQNCSFLKERRSSRTLSGKLFSSYSSLVGAIRK